MDRARQDRLNEAVEQMQALLQQLQAATGLGPGVSSGGSDLTKIARKLLEERNIRSATISGVPMGEPAWELMLFLYIAGAEQRQVSVGDAIAASGAPPTTGARLLARLEENGHLERLRTSGRQAVHVQLTANSYLKLTDYLLRLV